MSISKQCGLEAVISCEAGQQPRSRVILLLFFIFSFPFFLSFLVFSVLALPFYLFIYIIYLFLSSYIYYNNTSMFKHLGVSEGR